MEKRKDESEKEMRNVKWSQFLNKKRAKNIEMGGKCWTVYTQNNGIEEPYEDKPQSQSVYTARTVGQKKWTN